MDYISKSNPVDRMQTDFQTIYNTDLLVSFKNS